MVDGRVPMDRIHVPLGIMALGIALSACGSDVRMADDAELRSDEVEYVAFRRYGSEEEYFDGRFSVRIVIKDRESGYLADAALEEKGEPSSSEVVDTPIELGATLDLFGYSFRFLAFDPMLDSDDGTTEWSRWGVSGDGPPTSGCAASYGASDLASSLLVPGTSVEVEPDVYIRFGILRQPDGAFADPPELVLSVTVDGERRDGLVRAGDRAETEFGSVELAYLQISDDCRVERVEVVFQAAS